jgi:hypothetical protein
MTTGPRNTCIQASDNCVDEKTVPASRHIVRRPSVARPGFEQGMWRPAFEILSGFDIRGHHG